MEIEIERAKAICGIADRLIASAKVEVQFMEVSGAQVDSDFMMPKARPALTDGANGKHKVV